MNSLNEIIDGFRGIQRTADGVGAMPLVLGCDIGLPADPAELADAWGSRNVRPELDELWRLTGSARLFVDLDYGQWGLVLLSPIESRNRTYVERSRRPADFSDDDIVVGEFLGDQELLVVASDGCVLVALPLDARQDWWRAGPSVLEFLEKYLSAGGQKFWEKAGSPE